MAVEVGAAFVSLIPSARGFSRLAQREINKELPSGGLVVPVRPDVDTSALTRALTVDPVTVPVDVKLDETQVASALVDVTSRGQLTVGADVDTADLIADTRQAVAAAQATAPAIDVDVDVDRPALARALGRVPVEADARSLGQRIGGAALLGIGDTANRGIGATLSSLTSNPLVSTAGITLGTAIGVAASSAIAAALTAGILGGAGLGAIGLGALLLKDDPLLQQALSGFGAGVTQILRDAAQPLRDPLILGLDTVLNGIQAVAPDLERMFRGVAPFIQPLADGVRGFIEAFTPGLVDAVIASGPVLEQIAIALPDLGDAAADFLRTISGGAPEAGQFIGMLIRGLGDILRFLGFGIRVGTEMWSTTAFWMGLVWDLVEWGIERLAILGAVITGDLAAAFGWLQEDIGALIRWIKDLWGELTEGARVAVSEAIRWVKGLPGQIRSAVGDLGNLLYQAGRNVVQGLINGIRSMLGYLGDVASSMASTIRDYLPFSPAKEGPLSGSGNPYNSGQSIARMLAGGMESQLPVVASAGDRLAAAAGVGGGIRSAAAMAGAGARLTWAEGATGDRLLDALRDMIRIDYGGSPQAALGST